MQLTFVKFPAKAHTEILCYFGTIDGVYSPLNWLLHFSLHFNMVFYIERHVLLIWLAITIIRVHKQRVFDD